MQEWTCYIISVPSGNMDGCLVHLCDWSCALKRQETTSIQGFSVGALVFGGVQRIRESRWFRVLGGEIFGV
jgi:hypothetical protein